MHAVRTELYVVNSLFDVVPTVERCWKNVEKKLNDICRDQNENAS